MSPRDWSLYLNCTSTAFSFLPVSFTLPVCCSKVSGLFREQGLVLALKCFWGESDRQILQSRGSDVSHWLKCRQEIKGRITVVREHVICFGMWESRWWWRKALRWGRDEERLLKSCLNREQWEDMILGV